MRDIKFRAYHSSGGDPRVKGEMRYSSYSLKMFFENVENEDLSVDIMQYTGLKDKNGVEIYEGDIVDYDSEIGVITYENIMASFCFGGNQFDIVEAKYMEVIGNIYENHELLQ